MNKPLPSKGSEYLPYNLNVSMSRADVLRLSQALGDYKDEHYHCSSGFNEEMDALINRVRDAFIEAVKMPILPKTSDIFYLIQKADIDGVILDEESAKGIAFTKEDKDRMYAYFQDEFSCMEDIRVNVQWMMNEIQKEKENAIHNL